MRVAAALAVAACLLMAGCGDDKDQDGSTTGHTGCPIPVHYDKATLDRIQAALEKLPPDSVLRQAMTDYEQERDDLRFCR